MEIELHELRNLLADAAEIAIKRYRIENGEIKPFLTKAEARRVYGRSTIDRWILEGLIKPIQDGSKTSMNRLNRMELELLSKTSNRNTYLTKKER